MTTEEQYYDYSFTMQPPIGIEKAIIYRKQVESIMSQIATDRLQYSVHMTPFGCDCLLDMSIGRGGFSIGWTMFERGYDLETMVRHELGEALHKIAVAHYVYPVKKAEDVP
jgi:hypothetical protein